MKFQKRSVFVDGKIINYNHYIKNVKNINLRINKNREINVSSSKKVSVFFVDEFVKKNADFIFRALSKEIIQKINENQGLNMGDKILFLGNFYDVKIEKSNKSMLEIKNSTKEAIFFVRDENLIDERIKIYKKWENITAYELFSVIFEKEVQNLDFDFKIHLNIKKVKTYWGTMNIRKNIMTLNKTLIQTPQNTIKYVIIHELCHLIEPNHSRNFWKIVEQKMPDYKKNKDILNMFNPKFEF